LSVPGWLAYLTVFIATTLENVFPPTPSDVIVALAGFLSHHGVTTPWLVFLSAWTGGMVTSAGVYLVSRRHGRRFFAGKLGRRLLPTRAVAAMEREYQRFGATGLFLARLIPGVRTFVAPFAGLVNLSPAQVMVPIALASGVWYLALTWAGLALGAEWDAIVRFIGQLNLWLAIIGVLLVGSVIVWRLVVRRKDSRGNLLGALELALTAGQAPEPGVTAMLLREIARDEPGLGPADLAQIETSLQPLSGVVSPSASALGARSTAEVAASIADRFSSEERDAVLQRLCRLLADQGTLAPYRAALEAHAERLLRPGADGE
jgi:membrane protein DedA with SNARE-associated domain